VAASEILAALDLGTTRTRAVVAEPNEDGTLRLLGVGTAETRGIKKGVVVNLEATTEAVTHAVEEAELMSGVQIDSAYVGIGGGQVRGHNSRGVIAVTPRLLIPRISCGSSMTRVSTGSFRRRYTATRSVK